MLETCIESSPPSAHSTVALITTVGPLRLSSVIRKVKRAPSALPWPSAMDAVAPPPSAVAVSVASAVASPSGLAVGAGVLAAAPPPSS